LLRSLRSLRSDRAMESAYFVVASPTKKHVCSLLLSTAARDPVSDCSLSVAS